VVGSGSRVFSRSGGSLTRKRLRLQPLRELASLPISFVGTLSLVLPNTLIGLSLSFFWALAHR